MPSASTISVALAISETMRGTAGPCRGSRRRCEARRFRSRSGRGTSARHNAKVWNSPFSPHGSTAGGRSRSSAASNSRPAKEGSSMRVSMQDSRARKPPAIMSRASWAVGSCHKREEGREAATRKLAFAVGANVGQVEIAERDGVEAFRDGAAAGIGHARLVLVVAARPGQRHLPQGQARPRPPAPPAACPGPRAWPPARRLR